MQNRACDRWGSNPKADRLGFFHSLRVQEKSVAEERELSCGLTVRTPIRDSPSGELQAKEYCQDLLNRSSVVVYITIGNVDCRALVYQLIA